MTEMGKEADFIHAFKHFMLLLSVPALLGRIKSLELERLVTFSSLVSSTEHQISPSLADCCIAAGLSNLHSGANCPNEELTSCTV